MKKLFECIEKWIDPDIIKKLNKKLLIKAAAGILILAVAFSVYSSKTNSESDDEIILEPAQRKAMQQEQQTTESKKEEKPITYIYIDVAGAVKAPSVIELPEGSRVFQAIEKAGGMKAEGDTKYLNLAEALSDGQQIYVPTKEETSQMDSSEQGKIFSSGNGHAKGAMGYSAASTGGSSSAQSELVNINTADSSGLQQLSGVGPATADKIIDYRENYGVFEKIDDLKNVSGIGDKTFAKLKDKICIK